MVVSVSMSWYILVLDSEKGPIKLNHNQFLPTHSVTNEFSITNLHYNDM